METIELTAHEAHQLAYQVGKTGSRDTEEGFRMFRLFAKMRLTNAEKEACGYTKLPNGMEGMTHPQAPIKREVTQEQLETLRVIAQHPPVPWLTEQYEEFVPVLFGKLGITIAHEKEDE